VLSATTHRSVYAETFASTLLHSLQTSEQLGGVLDATTLFTSFASDAISEQFHQVARVIAARQTLQEERALFYVELGGFDTHNSLQETVQTKFELINAALDAFVTEMKAMGLWESVAVLTASDFARTMGSNGAGTDHAWGGNYALLGGGLDGGKMHGNFPTSLHEESEVNIGRNHRILPTTPWEAVWHGLAQWLGVADGHLAEVVPNAANFPVGALFSAAQLFTAP